MAADRPALAIPQTDPRAGYLAQRTAIDAAIARVLDSGSYILGREVESFEAAFANFLGVAHAVGVASGTDAIEIALRACEIGSGDLVFTVSHTAVATVAAIERAGATPVLVDVEPGTYTMASRELARALETPPSGRPAAVLPVHIYGQPAELSALTDIACAYGLRLIEDCAQSHGALYRGAAVGSFGDLACFSFYPTKNLGALGDGGMVVTNDSALATALHELREYGWRERYVSASRGINSRLDPIQAAILGIKLRSLPAGNARRQAIADRYDAGLRGLPLVLPARRPQASHVFHQYVIRLAARDPLREALRAAGIGSGVHYPVPVHQQPAYSGRLTCGPSGLGVTERAAPQILSLPIFPELSDDAVDRVIASIQGFFDRAPLQC
ncbi:MAG: DegT/DnrJ/EryC1/StrS family aminotransferase [Alphaproteobacteria bacterium]|nr:DegT/DnrJ/EryC1/StrS family aminotransferase [Alphaproteobacteria bacterium]